MRTLPVDLTPVILIATTESYTCAKSYSVTDLSLILRLPDHLDWTSTHFLHLTGQREPLSVCTNLISPVL